jgi:hypothetical protein
MTGATDFAKMVPGFDFLQGLMNNAGSALPSMGQWIAPTLNPEELGKRIEELRTVQFWLEQNARLLAATIQAMEVQRMTLSTLKTMNMPVADIANAFMLRSPAAAPPAEPEREPETAAATKPARKSSPKAAASATAIPGVVDPLQWWGALTQQFTQLAANALKDNPAQAATNLASDMVKQSLDSAGKTLKKAGTAPAKKKARAPARGIARRR